MSDELVQAAWDGDLAAIRRLIAAGDDPNEQGSIRIWEFEQWRPFVGLPLFAARDQIEVIDLLLELGADRDRQERGKGSALHYAAWKGRLGAVKHFLALGVDPNVRDSSGETPLHEVARCRADEAIAIAQLLLAAGADPRAKTDGGTMPSGVGARVSKELKQLLQKAAAKKRPPPGPKAPIPDAPPVPTNAKPPTTHTILSFALKEAKPDELPRTPIHLGIGPPMSTTPLGSVRIGLWMAELAAPFVDASEVEEAATLLRLTRAAVAAPTAKLAGELDAALATRKFAGSHPLGMASSAAHSASDLCKGAQNVWTFARHASRRMVGIVRGHRVGITVQEFLEQLDQRLMCEEMIAGIRQAGGEHEVVAILWRGTNMWIGRLATGEHAFCGKLRSKWTCSTGTLSDALACVPDNWFALATAFVS